MDPTIVFLAKLVGPMYLAISPLILFRPKLFDAIIEDFKKSPALSYYGGATALIVGIAWMMALFSWNNFTEIVFSLFGVLATIKGILLLVYPEAIYCINYKSKGFKIFTGLLTVLLGIWFVSIGYGMPF